MLVCQIWLTDFRVLASTLKNFEFCCSYFRLQSMQLEHTEKCVIHLWAEVQLSSQLSKHLLCWLRTMWIYTWNWGITHPGLCSWILLYPLVFEICIPFPLAALLLKLCWTLFPHSLYEFSPPLGQNFVKNKNQKKESKKEKKRRKRKLPLKFQFLLHSQIQLFFPFILKHLQVFIYVVFVVDILAVMSTENVPQWN